ncbi:MAG: metallophosphoesterase family protein [Solirubrobacteraceae bacterium]
MSFTVYYASDIHGSDRLWRKFVNAGRFYSADVLVMGGDITGKAVVPIIRSGDGLRAPELIGDRVAPPEELESLEDRVRDRGFYPYVTTEEELAVAHGDPARISELFTRAMANSVRRWLELAQERLAGTGIRLYMMLGNDDEPALAEVLADSPLGVDCEDLPVELAEQIQMMSCGIANPTPWNSPREMPEDQLAAHLESLVAELDDPGRSVFNLHVPPKGTALDQAPELDSTLKPVVRGGSVAMMSAGSAAVRELIERYQPLVALHGHIHESRAIAKVGRTVCINPGSEYGEGVLHGALMVLDRKKGLRNHQLVSG